MVHTYTRNKVALVKQFYMTWVVEKGLRVETYHKMEFFVQLCLIFNFWMCRMPQVGWWERDIGDLGDEVEEDGSVHYTLA